MIVRQVLPAAHRCLCPDEVVRQHGLVLLALWKASKRLAGTPSILYQQVHGNKSLQRFQNCLMRAVSSRELSVSHRRNRELIHGSRALQRGSTGQVVLVRGIEPSNDDGGVDQNHGRVRLSNSAPLKPRHLPAFFRT